MNVSTLLKAGRVRAAWRMYRWYCGIRLSQQDLTATNYPAEFFHTITSLSVVEHGVDLEAYFKEMSCLFKQGGFLITSTDYWAEHVDTKGLFPYGPAFGEMHIFTPGEIKDAVTIAATYGLHLIEEIQF